jgi:hypothetical protein
MARPLLLERERCKCDNRQAVVLQLTGVFRYMDEGIAGASMHSLAWSKKRGSCGLWKLRTRLSATTYGLTEYKRMYFWPVQNKKVGMLFFFYFFDTDTSEPALYKLLTFQVSDLISILRRLGRLPRESVQVSRGSCKQFLTWFFFSVKGNLLHAQPLSSRTTPCRFLRLLITYIRSWWPFLHQQPEDAPCCGDKGLYHHCFSNLL